jgi:TRAP-type transport system periplasmic protein
MKVDDSDRRGNNMKRYAKYFSTIVCGTMVAAAVAGCGATGTSASGDSVQETAAAGASDEVYELKLSTTQAETTMIYDGLQAAADKISEDTDGHVKITIYPSSQLGAEEDMIDQALQGMGIAVLTDAARLSSYVNDIGILNMAYFVDSYEEGLKIMETDTFKGWDEELSENGICTLAYNYFDGARSFLGHKAYEKPEDLKGVVIRTPGADPYVESISALGATPYNIAFSEVYNGIQTKSIDGCEIGYTSAVSGKFYEVCEYLSKTEHIQLFNMVICGQAWFDKLPEEYQEIVKADFYECASESAQSVIDAQPELEQTLIDNGMTIVEVDKDAFHEAAKTAYEKLGWTELREQLYEEAGLDK